MQATECIDIDTNKPIGNILKAKEERFLKGNAINDSFKTLCQLADIPDLGEGIITKKLDVEKILKLKESKAGINFREWFHKNADVGTKKITKEYIELLKSVPKTEKFPIKHAKFIFLNGIGTIPIVGNIANPVLSFIDNFVLNKLLLNNSPKIFLNNLKDILYIKPVVTTVPSQKKKKMGRNQPCPCGSGMKYKKCCGK